jgi:hypothetical protein
MEFLGILTGMLSVAGFFVWMLALSPVGKAYAERLRGRSGDAPGPEEMEQVLQSVEDVRREVAELSERVDFTERMLAQARERGALEPPK